MPELFWLIVGLLMAGAACGYGSTLNCGLYLFVRIGDGAAGRRWLRELSPQVTPAQTWDARPDTTLNVALTYASRELVRELGRDLYRHVFAVAPMTGDREI